MTTDSAPSFLDVRLLGGFAVAVDGQALPPAAWRRRRVAGLVKLLALEPGHRLHREQVMEALWPEFDPDAADNNLRFTLHEARKRLAHAGARPEEYLARQGDVLILGPPERLAVDIDAFERAAATAWRSDDPARTLAAIEHYPGDLLPEDPYEEWTESRRAALRAGYLALLRRLAELHLKRGEGAAAIAALERLVHAEPTDEAAHVRLMKVLARTGQRQRALAWYDGLVEILRGELDAAPEPATTRLRDEIAAGRYPAPREAPVAATPADGTLASPWADLPAPVDALIGREREVAEVGQLLATARLVTLTGPGGVGKTRLALEAGREMMSSFPDGALFIDLAPIRDPALTVSALAEAVGAREEPGTPLLESVKAMLRGRRALVLIDNFEQVAASGPVLSELLAACPGVKALVTSRVRLRLRGEREYPVGPLALPKEMVEEVVSRSPAVALFVERAREVKASFALSEENAADIGAICQRLDGLPLALELAAAWTRLLPPAAMRGRLETGRLALTGGARDLPERQQTIRAAIAWSYDLLTSEQQRLFRRLAVFTGGWTIEAAADVVAGAGELGVDVLEGLRALLEQSLIVEHAPADGEPRFTMLETIREFGLEQLALTGERDPTNRALFAFVLGMAEAHYRARYLPDEYQETNQIALLDRLHAEHANVQAALAWALNHDAEGAMQLAGALMWFWEHRGYISEGVAWLAAVLALPGAATESAARARALQGASNLIAYRGEFARAMALREEALAIRRAVGDQRGVASTLNTLGGLVVQMGDLERGEALLAEAMALARELEHEFVITEALYSLSELALERGDFDQAEAFCREGLERARQAGNGIAVADALVVLGRIIARKGSPEEATALFEEAVAHFRELEDRWGTGDALCEISRVMARDEPVRAAALLREGLLLLQEVGGHERIAAGLEVAGQIVAPGRPVEAAWLLGAAASLREATGSAPRRSEREEHERLVEALAAALGAEAFAATREEGWRMTREAAFARALDLLTENAEGSGAQARVEGVAQAVADERDGENGEIDHQAGNGDVRP